MAKKKIKLTMLTDCTDATLGAPNSLPLGPGGSPSQYIDLVTATEHPCSVCGRLVKSMWTVSRPFATTEGGNQLPAFALVCHYHGARRIELADDYISPGAKIQPDRGADDRCVEDPGCGTALLCGDNFYRCPSHAAEAGYCGVCGVEAESGVCPDCETLNGDLDSDDVKTVVCAACGDDVEVNGQVSAETICSVCGQPMVAGK